MVARLLRSRRGHAPERSTVLDVNCTDSSCPNCNRQDSVMAGGIGRNESDISQ